MDEIERLNKKNQFKRAIRKDIAQQRAFAVGEEALFDEAYRDFLEEEWQAWNAIDPEDGTANNNEASGMNKGP